MFEPNEIAYCSVKTCPDISTELHVFKYKEQVFALPSCNDPHCQAHVIDYLMSAVALLDAYEEKENQLYLQ